MSRRGDGGGLIKAPLLVAGDTHIWFASVTEWREHESVLRALLSRDELERAGRFHFDRDRRQFVTARGLLRLVLARYAACAPTELVLSVGAFGKPYLANPHDSPLAFNLSHSADAIAIGIARGGDLGIDVEQWVPDIDFLDLIERFFSPAERQEFCNLPPSQRCAAFFAGWTRKEAYIKATGRGVSRGLEHFDVPIAPAAFPLTIADRLDPSTHWALFDLAAQEGYSGALVLGGLSGEVRQFRLVPPAHEAGSR